MLVKLRVLLCLLVMTFVALSGARSLKAENEDPGLYDTPVYFEDTDRFYELVSLEHSYPKQFVRNATGWRQVVRLAEKRFHNGRRGRLAVVETPAVNLFLRETFKPRDGAWIGLKYYCDFGAVIWVNGKRLEKTAYQNWHSPWNVGGGDPNGTNRATDCLYLNFLPVHYWPYQDGFKWNANGPQKHMHLFFVEYPPPDEYWD